MADEMRMPRLSGSPTPARVKQWLCEEGQSVREGDDLLIVANETAEMRLPAPGAGVVKEILVDEGDQVEVGDLLAMLE
jgi:pyruvate/2-oxoglutarate dehydrogenase complex dihydrolipoamide acyltransferase (E2) component